MAASPPPAAVEAPAADANRAAWRAFHEREFARCERLATEAWALAAADRDSLEAVFAAGNAAAAAAMRGRLDEALEWSRRADERLGPGREPRLHGRLLVAQAIVHLLRGEDEACDRAFGRAREALGPEDWPLAYTHALARAYDWQDLNEAYQRMTALRDRARGSAEATRAAGALVAIGWIKGVGGGAGGVEPFEEARAVLAASGQAAVLPVVDHDIGAVLLDGDRLDEAQAAFERGLAAARAVGDRRLEVILLDDLSLLFSQKEDWPRAVAADREAGGRLAAIAEDLRQGRLDDSPLLDVRRLFKERYVHRPQLLVDLFLGFLDQLAVEPGAAENGR